MLNASYIRHDLSLAHAILIIAVRAAKDSNSEATVLTRAAMNTIEFLMRNIDAQERGR